MSTASCWGEGVSSDAARRGAIKNHRVVINRRSPCLVCAYGGGGKMGGGIFAKTAKTPPLQSALRSALRPNTAHCHSLHAYTMPHMETGGFYHDAVRRVATSSEKRENRF